MGAQSAFQSQAGASNLSICLGVEAQPAQFEGELAGQRVQSPLACAFLSPRLTPLPAGTASKPFPSDLSAQGEAELEQIRYPFRAAHGPQGSSFEFPRVARLSVANDGSFAHLSQVSADPALWLFGPALILALARRGVFCLHASAVADSSGAVLYVAASGAGKSTIARYASLLGARRLCDDITPLRWTADGVQVLPQFPQFKLAVQEIELPQAVPLRRICWLDRSVTTGLTALPTHVVGRKILQHTVGAKLFSPTDLGHHLQFAGALAAALQRTGGGHALGVPWQPNALDGAMLTALQISLTL